MLEAGFAKVDITPRVGVELCGFGPFLNRHSICVRDRLFARAVALRAGGRTAVIISCDLVGVVLDITHRTRALITEGSDVDASAVMVHCTHTHSGPSVIANLAGWGDPDRPYIELLPHKLARAGLAAVADLKPAALSYAAAPCEGIGLNREYDVDQPPLEEVLDESWRPAKPELTDTVCHIIRLDVEGGEGGFLVNFGCHPVVCCSQTRYIHGDYCGVAMGLLERERPGVTGMFLQGAQGDVNSCVVHKPEQEALLALDVVAARFARAVRHGLAAATPVAADDLCAIVREVAFTRKDWGVEELRQRLREQEAILHAPDASDANQEVRMAMVYAIALRDLIRRSEVGESLQPTTELQGIALGPLAFLAAPFEIFQAIKNEVRAASSREIPLVLGITNDLLGYAPDHTAAERGGYAADMVPLMVGELPFASIHDELARELKALDTDLPLCLHGFRSQAQ